MAAETADLTPEHETPFEDVHSAAPGDSTAVLLVHGLGEPRPLQTLDDFVKTALHPQTADGQMRWDYSPRPTEITGSYEARRFQTNSGEGRTEFYEYDWRFLLTANRFAGVTATALRLFLRRPGNVPGPLFGIWRLAWLVLIAALMAIPALLLAGYALNTDVPAWIAGVVISAVVLVFWFGLYRLGARALVNKTTAPLADAARYLDSTPDSYAARRAVRGGLVDLLRALHERRYSRIVVVAHGVGTYIAYDALAAFWAETHDGHPGAQPPAALDDLERWPVAVDEFQNLQFALWQDLQSHGDPWRITDFVTVGAPLALADLMVTRPPLFSGFQGSDGALRHELFDGLVRRGALVRCPPWTEDDATRDALAPYSLFAVTRWTNLWFPVIRGELGGDWFGGPLSSLFGSGIRDIAVRGNMPERLRRGSAHREYFAHPDKHDEGDVAWHLRKALALQTRSVGADHGAAGS